MDQYGLLTKYRCENRAQSDYFGEKIGFARVVSWGKFTKKRNIVA